MKKIIALIILLLTVMSCSEMEAKSQQIKRERGYECTYNSRGEAQVCGYIK